MGERVSKRRGITLALLVWAFACGPGSHEELPVDGGWESEPERSPSEAEPIADEPVEERSLPAGPAAEELPPSYRLAYDERRPKSILELQPQRRTFQAQFISSRGSDGLATLVDLNPAVGQWLLLRIEFVGGGEPQVYHLENPFPRFQRVFLDPQASGGLMLDREGDSTFCDLWSDAPGGPLSAARREGRPFAPLCDGWLYLRNPTEGRRTSKEWATDFLRDRVWGGERITTLVRDTVFKDSHRKKGRLSGGEATVAAAAPGLPAPPLLSEDAAGRRIEPSGLGLSVEREADGSLVAGRWYRVVGASGVAVSAIRPDMVAPEIVERQGSRVNVLEPKEASALVYLVAFDLSRLELGFALGTEHPRVNWSERVLDSVRDDSLPGPDGIGTVAPLVRTGMLGPAQAVRVVATFTGGFKRSHGAFRSAELGLRNGGSHYGFVEQGVIFSKLQPGLSTLTVFRDGRVALGTWTSEMDAELGSIRYARQNGVPILERDPTGGTIRPGSLVRSWGDGNWSGSVDKQLRTLRAGACLQRGSDGVFLLYGYFSSATPSAMARVFEAYGCGDAMLLDMNALEHTYLAVYPTRGPNRSVERLIDEMEVLDKVIAGETVPRFVGFPDNRDFFFLLARSGA